MKTMAEIREMYPQYADVPDAALIEGLHKKFYSHLPLEDVVANIDMGQAPATKAPVEVLNAPQEAPAPQYKIPERQGGMQMSPEQAAAPNAFLEELGGKLAATAEQGVQGAKEIMGFDVDPASKATMLASEAIQGVGGAGVDLISTLWSQGLPDALKEKAKTKAGEVKDWAMESPTVRAGLEAAMSGIENWSAFAKDNPADARQIEAVFDVGALAFPRVNPVPDKLLATTGKAVLKDKKKLVAKALQPEPNTGPGTWRETSAAGGRAAKYEPTPGEREMYDVVSTVPGLDPSRTSRHAVEKVTDEIGATADRLVKAVHDGGNPPVDVQALKDRILVEMQDLPNQAQGIGLIGDAGRVAQNVLEESAKLIDASDGTAAGLLAARKEFDRLLKRVRGDGVFNAERESGISAASRVVRDALNETVDAAVPSAKVHDLLNRQRQLYVSLDTYVPKAQKEAGNAISRVVEKIRANPAIPGTILSAGMAASFLMANAMAAGLTAGALGLYVGGKALPGGIAASKKAVHELLRATDKMIGSAQELGDAGLRADRAILLDYLKSLDEEQKREQRQGE